MRVCNPDVCPLELIVETQPQLQPALLRLSATISHYFIETDSAFAVSNDEKCAVIFSIHANSKALNA
jgi:hypothetical protein